MSEAARALRRRVPRSSFGRWKADADRDPLSVLQSQEHGRDPSLLPIRHERMAKDPFSFYRGAAAIMAADLAMLPVTGLRAQLCGDAHVMNFGAYASPERRLVFDINDFDETLPGPWEWDIMRLCASLQIAGNVRGFRKDRCDDAAFAAARAYRIAMRGFAEMAPLDVWYSSIDVEHLLQSELTMAQSAQSLVPKLTVNANGALRFIDHPPLFVRLDPTDPRAIAAHRGVRAYRGSLPVHIRTLLDRYHVVDIAEKVVGVGSVGTLVLAVLLLADDRQPLLLQVKGASASVLDPYAGASPYADDGERVVVGQRLMQAATDIFLGYALVDGASVYVRQLRDMKAALDLASVDAPKFIDYAGHCGEVLARGHARSGEPAAIGGYLGRSANFEEGMVEFSHAYARTNDRDHDAFVRKIRWRFLLLFSQKADSRYTMMTWMRATGPVALSCALFFGLVGAAPETPQPLPPAAIADVHESYNLLTKSFYQKVDSNALFTGAREALVAAAAKNGAKVSVPAFTGSNADENLEQLDEAIASVTAQAHGDALTYTYVAVNGMARAVHDRWTEFMTPDEFKQFNNALDPQRISGIGVLIDQDPDTKNVRASYVVPNTPAERAGLQNGDEFVTIDGKPTKGMTRDQASAALRGAAGTVVRLQVSSEAKPARAVDVTRSEILPPTVTFKMLPGDIGYVYVIAFGRATPDEFDTAIERLKSSGARAYVLDLRNDGGGYVDSALQISSRFIANRPLLTVEERTSPTETIQAENDVTVHDAPVTVLVNGFTASASEITAGALQDDGIAMLVGTRTFGKGVMQTLTQLPGGAAIKITTAHYLTPNHRDINMKGIDPDVRVDAPKTDIFGVVDKDAQLRAAVELLQKKIAQAHP